MSVEAGRREKGGQSEGQLWEGEEEGAKEEGRELVRCWPFSPSQGEWGVGEREGGEEEAGLRL